MRDQQIFGFPLAFYITGKPGEHTQRDDADAARELQEAATPRGLSAMAAPPPPPVGG